MIEATMIKKRGRPKKSDKPYLISIAVGDKILEGSGLTLLSALQSMTPPVKITTKGLVQIKQGERKFEETLIPRRIKRLFYPNFQAVLAKQLETLMR